MSPGLRPAARPVGVKVLPRVVMRTNLELLLQHTETSIQEMKGGRQKTGSC